MAATCMSELKFPPSPPSVTLLRLGHIDDTQKVVHYCVPHIPQVAPNYHIINSPVAIARWPRHKPLTAGRCAYFFCSGITVLFQQVVEDGARRPCMDGSGILTL